MATRGTIIVKIDEKDKGVNLKVSEDFLNKHKAIYTAETYDILEDLVVEQNQNYMSIYHHFDSYPEGLGEALNKDYNDYESALQLCLCGDMSTAIDGIRSYTLARGEEWDYNKPKLGETSEELKAQVFTYLFEDGKWTII